MNGHKNFPIGQSIARVFVGILLTCSACTALAEMNFDFDSQTEIKATSYGTAIPNTEKTFGSLHEQLSGTWKFNKTWRGRLSLVGQVLTPEKSIREKSWADIREARIEVRPKPFQFSLGYNVVSWGVTDVINPVDVVSPKRMYDPLNIEKRGSPMFQAKFEKKGWQFETIYIPYHVESQLPGENSRWLPRDVVIKGQDGQFVLPDAGPVKYRYLEKFVWDNALRDNYGLRLGYSGHGVDVGAMYFEGAADVSGATPTIFGELDRIENGIYYLKANPEVGLSPQFYRRQMSGVTFTWTLSQWILKMVAAHYAIVGGQDAGPVRDSALPGWSDSGALQIERAFAVGQGTVTGLASFAAARHQTKGDNLVSSLDRIFDRAYLLGFRWSMESGLNAQLAGLWDTVDQGVLIQGKLEARASDHFQFYLSTDQIQGRSGTALGSYRDNDRYSLGMIVSF